MTRHTQDARLVGWKRIADYLGQPVPTAQRWAAFDGMPVRREGRYVEASAEELSRWLGRESASKQPVHITHVEERDLTAELRRGLRNVRSRKRRAA